MIVIKYLFLLYNDQISLINILIKTMRCEIMTVFVEYC